MPAFALFRNGEQVSKVHPVRQVVVVEAAERGLVHYYSADFPGDPEGFALAHGVEIREVGQDVEGRSSNG